MMGARTPRMEALFTSTERSGKRASAARVIAPAESGSPTSEAA